VEIAAFPSVRGLRKGQRVIY